MRLARKRRLTTKRRDYATGWLAFGLENLADLRLESRELEIRNALDTVSRQALHMSGSPDAAHMQRRT